MAGGSSVDVPPNPQTLSFEEARAKYNANKLARRAAADALDVALKKRAAKRRDASWKMASAFAQHRAAGKPVEQCKIQAKSDVAQLEFEADMADAEAKAAKELIETLEAERATLRQLSEWSQGIDRGAA